ncbi:hypothetical protein GQ55_8G127500 [Panicum hallii var. hallii]|uniref:Uncharacterized protein n=1 Tax=Panicum hallii var. hallii TaxID=1504633 RepID=A0A2T7CMW1_9POAL|nr:hypothetical protein GQ55_8G127500 [Panicum hallii var. hallii]
MSSRCPCCGAGVSFPPSHGSSLLCRTCSHEDPADCRSVMAPSVTTVRARRSGGGRGCRPAHMWSKGAPQPATGAQGRGNSGGNLSQLSSVGGKICGRRLRQRAQGREWWRGDGHPHAQQWDLPAANRSSCPSRHVSGQAAMCPRPYLPPQRSTSPEPALLPQVAASLPHPSLPRSSPLPLIPSHSFGREKQRDGEITPVKSACRVQHLASDKRLQGPSIEGDSEMMKASRIVEG